MAKTRHEQPEPSSRGALAAMAIGGILVAALVVWALTRTVEPAAPTAPASEAPAQPLQTATVDTTGLTPTASAGTDPSAAATSDDPASVRRISVEDLREQMRQVTIIDVRTADAYARGHIPGALNIPMAAIEAQVASLPKDRPIVTYCT